MCLSLINTRALDFFSVSFWIHSVDVVGSEVASALSLCLKLPFETAQIKGRKFRCCYSTRAWYEEAVIWLKTLQSNSVTGTFREAVIRRKAPLYKQSDFEQTWVALVSAKGTISSKHLHLRTANGKTDTAFGAWRQRVAVGTRRFGIWEMAGDEPLNLKDGRSGLPRVQTDGG